MRNLEKFAISLISVALLTMGSSQTFAQDAGFKFIDNPSVYLGAGAGRSSIDAGVTATTGTATLDEDDIGYKAFAGLQINKFLAAEVFYANLGEAELTGNNGDTFGANGTTSAWPTPLRHLGCTGRAPQSPFLTN